MIIITYRTSELKSLGKDGKPKYEAINTLLKEISIVDKYLEDYKSFNDILEKINSENEQIFYEPVNAEYKEKQDVDYVENWKKLFEMIDRKILEFNKSKEKGSVIQNKVFIVNNTETLGPWQSLEVLTSLRHNSLVYWISVDALVGVVGKVIKANFDDKNEKRLSFSKELLKQAKQLLI